MAHANATVRAVVVDPDAPGKLVLADVPRPEPGPGEALIRVSAISLNRGEVRQAMTAAAGWRPGWDFAGVVAEPAADGSGPPAGTRVFGVSPALAAWAELIAISPFVIAPLPDAVSFEAAAALPVAGATAQLALAKGPQQAGRRVLITGASGGVGVFAVQLAAISGAEVTAAIRNPAYEPLMRRLGAHHVAVGETPAEAAGPFDLILDSVGGRTLGAALGLLAPGGMCVLIGASEGSVTEFDAARFRAGGTSLYGFVGNYELTKQPPGPLLAGLAALVAEGRLDPVIERRGSVEEIGAAAHELIERKFVGKAVLRF
jgi:NADPH:quinone reductase-like Zn-dependent oxidoreductase